MCEWDESLDNDIEETEDIAIPKEFESSFTYHAIPLDQLETIGEDGIIYSIKELMDLKDLKEELGDS